MNGSISATIPARARASCRCWAAMATRDRSLRKMARAKPTRAKAIAAVVLNQSSRLPRVDVARTMVGPSCSWCMTMGWISKGQVYHFELAPLSQTVNPAWC
jgi:hypothetical protein